MNKIITRNNLDLISFFYISLRDKVRDYHWKCSLKISFKIIINKLTLRLCVCSDALHLCLLILFIFPLRFILFNFEETYINGSCRCTIDITRGISEY